ncbi:hypothetical protein BOTBODRAFT_186157 [Botryobasidium botryosum FD-172 SS1]|uniref:Uncharacterized protein n=1 Tax=Botryobasidium botryosum (strain FD-172 SS1) TaxID=930990 RepID=A0A067MZL1_BOTB1|nr:hypothetical protein BOTBODRAFT_186157 [Botryobasidium botryosum FD-172 SS1]
MDTRTISLSNHQIATSEYNIFISNGATEQEPTINKSVTRPEIQTKALLNRSMPIHRLPNEILTTVFELAMAHGSYPRPAPEKRPPFNVMLVSTLWRDIVISSPMLWTYIDMSNLPLVEMFISRSRQAALDIDFIGHRSKFYPDLPPIDAQVNAADNGYPREFFSLIEPLLPHLDRWRSLVTNRITAPDLHSCLLLPAPKLESFLMRSPRNHENEAPPYDGIPVFAGHTPRLRNLDLDGAYFPLRYSIYTELTSLKLSAIRYSEPVQQLLQNIQYCPRLEKISLSGVQFSSGADGQHDSTIYSTISLPHLKSIVMYSLCAGDVRHILTSIMAPHAFLWVSLSGADLPSILPHNPTLPDNFSIFLQIDTVRLILCRDDATPAGIVEGKASGVHAFRVTFPLVAVKYRFSAPILEPIPESIPGRVPPRKSSRIGPRDLTVTFRTRDSGGS